MQIYKHIDAWQNFRQQLSCTHLGFVPTMGALHAGHMKLIKRCRQENAHVAVSIFLNPTQFDQSKDLETYPQTLQADIELLQNAGVDSLILPDTTQMYADNYRFALHEKDFSTKLCGMQRIGHFDGVLTVVLKLFNLVRPHRAYFGKKDFQQYLIIKDMVEALFLNIEIIGCETVRDKDGLALSSRNQKLSTTQRKQATLLYEYLQKNAPLEEIENSLKEKGFNVDYIEELEGRRFAAAWLGEIRLIDNVEKHSL